MNCEEAAILLEEGAVWRSRKVQYWGGNWPRLKRILPTFEKAPFTSAADGPPNPFFRSVVRLPQSSFENAVPVGIVSPTYNLIQHETVARLCMAGIDASGIDPQTLHCELGLSELGEWMNFRVYFPRRFDLGPEDDSTKLRLECFNSVDGSTRLVLLLGWIRLICSNGMVLGEIRANVRRTHHENLVVEDIPALVLDALGEVEGEVQRYEAWKGTPAPQERLADWSNNLVTATWGKKAACRVFHICISGFDVEFTNPFAPGPATEKPVKRTHRVPGSVAPARTLYDVSQALSWVGSRIENVELRVERQGQISELVGHLGRSLRPNLSNMFSWPKAPRDHG